jgi:hypothetical protein
MVRRNLGHRLLAPPLSGYVSASSERFGEDPEPPQNATAVQAMRRRLQTQEGKAVYAKRTKPPWKRCLASSKTYWGSGNFCCEARTPFKANAVENTFAMQYEGKRSS